MIGECPSPNKRGCHIGVGQYRCRSNEHHLYWPARDYKTEIENEFRELPENKVQLCMYDHDMLHVQQEPPQKPTLETMIVALTVQIEVQDEQEAA